MFRCILKKKNPTSFTVAFLRANLSNLVGKMVIPAGFEARNLNRRDCPLGRSLVSVEKGTDEIPATGGRQCIFHGRRVFESAKHNTNRKPSRKGNVIQIMILAARAKELTTDQKVVSSLVIQKRVCKTSRCYHLLKYGV